MKHVQVCTIRKIVATRSELLPPQPFALHKEWFQAHFTNKVSQIITLNSTYNEKNMQRFSFVIGGFSLRAMHL